MTIKELIEKGLEGGWKPFGEKGLEVDACVDNYIGFFGPPDENGRGYTTMKLVQILLDPDFWKAVGKVEGWDGQEFSVIFDASEDEKLISEAQYRAHQMIDALWQGQSLEDYIKTL